MKTTRSRKGDRPAPAAPSVPRPPAKPAPPPPELSPKLAATDLEALLQMDRGELDALMGGNFGRSRAREGEKVTGTITRLGRDDAFVDLGGKSEGVIALPELDGKGVGDTITAFVLSADEGGVRLSRQLSGRAAASFLDEAAESGVPVEGKVTGRNSGGYEVKIGTVRAFCPISQMDRVPEADPEVHVGKTYTFKVMSAEEDEPILSRRALLDDQVEEQRKAFFATAKPGDTFTGVVTSVQAWGVFVDVGGVEGLVHKSELAWDPVTDASGKYVRGQRLDVRLLELDPERRKVSFSAKDPNASPWARVGTDFVPGGIYEGTVTGVERYGAFVQLAAGLQGLLHVSRHTGSLPKPGDDLRVKLVSADVEKRRLELADPDWQGDARDKGPATEEDQAWAAFRKKGEAAASLGTFGDLMKGIKIGK